jgi:hypothetical protein
MGRNPLRISRGRYRLLITIGGDFSHFKRQKQPVPLDQAQPRKYERFHIITNFLHFLSPPPFDETQVFKRAYRY